MPRQQLSSEDIEAYFFHERHPKMIEMLYVGIGFSIAVAILCVVFLILWIAPGVDLIVLGVCVALGGGCSLVVHQDRKRRPTDKRYDLWLQGEIERLYDEKLQMLGIEEQQIVDDVLCFHSHVLPDARLARNNKMGQICLKQGKDGKYRSSVTVHTYFIPTTHFIGVVVFDFNALYPRKHDYQYQDYNQPYAYRSITKVRTETSTMDIIYNNKPCSCEIRKLRITIHDGTTFKNIDITGAIRATFEYEKMPITLAPTKGLERQINLLRQLLIVHQK